MTNTWISEAMQAGRRLVGWRVKEASGPPGKTARQTQEDEFYEFKPYAAQAQKLLTFQNDFLTPLVEELKRGLPSPAADAEHVARFVRTARDLGRQFTHPALSDMADLLLEVGEKDFTQYKTYQDLVQLNLAIEEVGRTMNGRMRELRQAYPRRPSNKR